MSDHMKEAERLLSEYGDAVSDAVVFAQDPAGYSMRMEEATRAAMLAHIQRGAVPDGWQLVPKEPTPEMLAGGWGYWLNVMAPGKQRDTAAKEYTAMLAAAPSPDQFRGAAKMVPAPAEVPMPEPDTHCYDDDEQRDVWSRTDQMLTYGDAREAAGYARGLAEGVARTGLTPAEHDVLAERHRQISAEGWTPEHDDGLRAGDLPMAAACYAAHAGTSLKTLEYSAAQSFVRQCWPWSPVWWKPTAPRRDLVKAAALLLAEIERLDRAALRGEVKP